MRVKTLFTSENTSFFRITHEGFSFILEAEKGHFSLESIDGQSTLLEMSENMRNVLGDGPIFEVNEKYIPLFKHYMDADIRNFQDQEAEKNKTRILLMLMNKYLQKALEDSKISLLED